MKIYKALLLMSLVVAALSSQANETTAKITDPKAAMVSEMQAAVNAIAIKHGNLPFTQIFTNEPQRAAAVRQRFMEIERADNLAKQVLEMELRLKTLQENVQASQAIFNDLDQKVAARKVELASLTTGEGSK